VDWASLLILVAAGATAGCLSTMFGIGGGIVMVPAMHYLLRLDWATATGLSLVAIAVQSPYGIHQHWRRQAVDWRLAWPMAVGGLAGVAMGDFLQPHLPVASLKLVFAAVMALAAYRMLRPDLRARIDRQHVAVVLGLGVAAGILAKLLGIGGGLLTVPALVLLGTPIHVAIGSSLVPVFTNAAIATALHAGRGLDVGWGLILGAAALATVPLGARAAHSLKAGPLRRLFAAALIVAAAYIAMTRNVGS